MAAPSVRAFATRVPAMTPGLTGGMDDRWPWSLDYTRRFDGDAAGGDWFVGLRREF